MSSVEVVIEGGLAEIILDRPERKNALRGPDWEALAAAARSVGQSEARAVLVRGAGGDFCSGFDIGEIEPDKADAFHIIDKQVNPALRALRDIPQPTVAAVSGACVGGGFGIAALCDIVIADSTARFGAPYSAIGIMCDAGLHTFLRDTLGHQRAAYLIFTGAMVPASEAAALGLCNEVVGHGDLDGRARALAHSIAAGPSTALRLSKRILRTIADPDEALDAEARFQAEVFRTEDARNGIGAFLARSKVTFTGR
jgi:2-(1,2-epoxy-1,2-dihydrophenyl)acetyl-CoA isomerase